MNDALHWKEIALLAGNCIKELDADGRVVAVNVKCLEQFEAESEDELLGRRWNELWPPSLQPTAEEAFNRAKQGEPAHFEGDAPTLRGNIRSWEVNVIPSPPEIEPSRFLIIHHDVTALKQANAALTALNAALRIEVDTHRHDTETASSRYRDVMLRMSEQSLRSQTTLVSLNSLRAKLHSAEKDLNLANAAKLVAETAVARSYQERVIAHVVGGVAHDLNNMLASTLMSLGMIPGYLNDPPPKVSQLLAFAAEASEQAAKLSKRLMAFVRTHEIALVEVDLGEIVENICAFVAHSLGGRSHLNWVRPERRHLVVADPHLIEQALVNLCINARHASAEGEIIEIRLDTKTIGAQISPHEPAGSYVTLSVIDHGTGMAPEVQARLFEPYFTTKQEGSGLGLAQVYGLMKLAGGFVHVESKLGHGTTVLLAFPTAIDAVVSADKTIVDPHSA